MELRRSCQHFGEEDHPHAGIGLKKKKRRTKGSSGSNIVQIFPKLTYEF